MNETNKSNEKEKVVAVVNKCIKIIKITITIMIIISFSLVLVVVVVVVVVLGLAVVAIHSAGRYGRFCVSHTHKNTYIYLYYSFIINNYYNK